MPQEVDKRKVPSRERFAQQEQYVKFLETFIRNKGIQLPAIGSGNYLTPGVEPQADTYLSMISDHSGGLTTPAYYPSQTHSTDNSADTDVDLLSERLGSLQVAEDGQLRFFGPTSNLHIAHVGPFPLVETAISSIHGQEQDILRRACLDQCVDDDLEEHLLQSYFCWENPNIPVVDEATYYKEREIYRRAGLPSHRYSELLTNSM